MSFLRINDLDFSNKSVLIREDLNVPIKDGKITNVARLQASLPTIKLALEKGAGVTICSHLGRPTEGTPEDKFSMQPVADYLSQALNKDVKLIKDHIKATKTVAGEVQLLENVRFNVGEKKNNADLANQYANLCDIFVMDAFGTAHRSQASTEGVIQACKQQGKKVCAGLLLAKELDALSKALNKPEKPMIAIVGGSKVSSKLEVLTSLAQICDSLIVGGGIANTFIVAQGHNVGASLYEADLVDTAKEIMSKVEVLLPEQVVVAKTSEIDFDDFVGSLANAQAIVKSVAEVADDEMILDIAPTSAEVLVEKINQAKTILWNGPVGVFEVDKFGEGTKIISQAVQDSEGFSIAGGGDTLSAIYKYKVENGVSYMSTGGGAFLEFVEGKALPAVVALQNC